MIFYHPILLAGEFVQHTLAIVLAGVLCVEYYRCYMSRMSALHTAPIDTAIVQSTLLIQRNIKTLLIISLLSAWWLISEFFGDVVWYPLTVHMPIVIILAVMLARFAYLNIFSRVSHIATPSNTLRVLAGALLFALMLYMIIELPFFEILDTRGLAHDAARLMESVLLFFFVMANITLYDNK